MYVRFDMIMKSKDLTQKEFAEICGFSQQALASMKKMDSSPSALVIANIHNKLPLLNISWLLTGQGEMWTEAQKKSSSPSVQPYAAEDAPATEVGEAGVGYARGVSGVRTGGEVLILAGLQELVAELHRLRAENALLRELQGLPPRPAPVLAEEGEEYE
jgi:transcriptional regulator with XRE-family HTH domain